MDVEYLAHHGVKGMRWGVRKKYEPVGRTKSQNSIEGRKGKAGYIAYRVARTAASIAIPKVGGLAVSMIYNKLQHTNPSKEYVNKVLKNIGDQQIPKISNLPKLDREHSPIDDMRDTNPNFYKSNEYKINCTNCVVAYEMRRRGYDVEAAPLFSGRMSSSTGEFFKGFSLETASGAKEALAKASSWGEGARGVVEVNFGKNGHIFNVEVRNGKASFMDGQIGKSESYSKWTATGFSTIGQFKIGRTDNLKMLNTVTNAVVPRKGNKK